MINKINLEVACPEENGGIRSRYPVEQAKWVRHPQAGYEDRAVYTFALDFESAGTFEDIFHLSADQRYEFYLDGGLVSCGPDRCDLMHWSFSSFSVKLEPGKHTLKVEVLWLGEDAPAAQVYHSPCFIFAAEKNAETFNTGTGKWQVSRMGFAELYPSLKHFYHVIGPGYSVRAADLRINTDWQTPLVLKRQHSDNAHGVQNARHCLYPSRLPEQKRDIYDGGAIRAVVSDSSDAHIFSESDFTFDKSYDFIGSKSISIGAGEDVKILWDLDNYYCGYPLVDVCGGEGASISLEWAESLFEPSGDGVHKKKGNRDQVDGKVFVGFGDKFFPDGQPCGFKSYWWRSGRYVLLTVKTAQEALTLKRIAIRTTRYPLDMLSEFSSSDNELDGFSDLAVRVLQVCAHETFMDCPYYEQMMYAGDTRLELLTWFTMSDDDKFVQRCIELFDWSRSRTGFVAERYPSDPFQLSLTFSMIYIYMLHDYFMWRDDNEWLKKRLRGLRCLLENFRAILNNDGLLEGVPGWSFVDWVPGWKNGMPSGASDNVSPIVNLMFSYALKKAADIENHLGEEVMAERNLFLAGEIDRKTIDRFWSEGDCLFADNIQKTEFSEHTQCIALLAGSLPDNKRQRCFDALISNQNLSRTTIYFSFYMFETLKQFGRGDLLLQNMDMFKKLKNTGFKTVPEQPEPSRSDCHAWGAHPLFHYHASLLGVRPVSAGMKQIEISPLPGKLEFIRAKVVHPRGFISADLDFKDGGCRGTVTLPDGVRGIFNWGSRRMEISGGVNNI